MAKFFNYEDRLEIQNGLNEHLTFTQIGENLSRNITTITKEIRNYSVEQDKAAETIRTMPVNTGKPAFTKTIYDALEPRGSHSRRYRNPGAVFFPQKER